jgi:hypothetical protein
VRAVDFSHVARRWIIANAIAIIVSSACVLAALGARSLLTVETFKWLSRGHIAYAVIEILLNPISFAIYALLIGSVLRLIVPNLPRRLWLALHVVMGALIGAGIAFSFSDDGDSDPIEWSEVSMGAAIFVTALFALGGALLGAALGAVQAIALRRVALGLRFWIGMAAVSGSFLLVIVLAAFRFFQRPMLESEVAIQCVGLLGALVSTFIMLPALRRLRPRT